MWNQQKRRDIIVNAERWKPRNLSLQTIIVHKEKVSQRTSPSEQSQLWITTQGIQKE